MSLKFTYHVKDLRYSLCIDPESGDSCSLTLNDSFAHLPLIVLSRGIDHNLLTLCLLTRSLLRGLVKGDYMSFSRGGIFIAFTTMADVIKWLRISLTRLCDSVLEVQFDEPA